MTWKIKSLFAPHSSYLNVAGKILSEYIKFDGNNASELRAACELVTVKKKFFFLNKNDINITLLPNGRNLMI